MGEQNIIVERDESVGIITLNRPEVLNALSSDLQRNLADAVSEMEADSDIKAIVFTGSGERAFSAGADIHEMARLAENPDPTEEEIRDALVGNLCRCTGYVNIITSVRAAAEALRAG